MTVLEQLKLIVFLIPFIGVCGGCYRLNLPKWKRGRQVLMPVVSILLSIYAIFKIQQLYYELYDSLNYMVDAAFSSDKAGVLDQTVSEMVKQSGLTGEAAAEAERVAREKLSNIQISNELAGGLKQLKSVLGGAFQLNLILSYIINLACALIFLCIKGALLPILNKFWDNDELMRMTVKRFYEGPKEIPQSYIDKITKKHKKKEVEDDEETNASGKDEKKAKKGKKVKKDKKDEIVSTWVVLPQTPSYRKLLLGMYVGVFVASIVIFLVSLINPDWAAFKAPFYPVFILLIFGEVVAFLDGITYEKEPEKPKEEVKKPDPINPNYRKIWDDLRTIYSENMLRRTPDVLEEGKEQKALKIDKDLGFLLNSDDENLKTIAQYFEKYPEEEIEPSYIEGCIRLLQGKSTLFCNPFYEDLDKYLFPAIIYHLLSYKKCLFIMGRDSTAEDFKAWLKKGILDFLGAEGLWQTEIMSEAPVSFELGILKFSDIYNLNLLKTNREFFSEVGFVFILEPSRILATGQLALSLIINQLDIEHCDEITYCACDHNCDGLVDTLSHTLKTNMTNVIATLPGNGLNLQIYWDADSQNMQYRILENVTHYLGIGTEISLVGMKHHVCNDMSLGADNIPLQNECWFACDKFPIMDMMWIAGQYYHQICQYTGQKIGQQQFNKALEVRSNIWHCPKALSTYLIVEDEYNNLFEMSRIFSSRSLKEGFVNIISSHYLLRDYMIQYIDLFQSDAKAIPTIVPDYARTERNVILKLLMMMKSMPLSEEYIRSELRLGGIRFNEDEQEKFYEKFCEVVGMHISDFIDNSEKIEFKRTIKDSIHDDGISVDYESYYEIREGDNVISRYLRALQNAYFICEDELSEMHYISAKLYGHVFQSYLPGQFITMDGKYYQIVSISENKGILLRRAADHIDKRLYYRQLRDVTLNKWKDDKNMGSSVTIELQSGMKLLIEHGFADYDVKTPGYLECAPYNDIKHARIFELKDIPDRKYYNKNVLRLKLPEITQEIIDFKLNDICESAESEQRSINAKYKAIDEKAQKVFNETVLRVNANKIIQNKLLEEATLQAENHKKDVLKKVMLNRTACLKLRDGLVKFICWENNYNVKVLTADENNAIISDLFNSLNNADVIEKVRFTICLLLTEIFKTTYPESWQYINVVTHTPQGMACNLKNANYHFADNRLKEALKLVKNKKWNDGRRVLEALLKDYPGCIDICQLLSIVYRHLGLIDKADAMNAELIRQKEDSAEKMALDDDIENSDNTSATPECIDEIHENVDVEHVDVSSVNEDNNQNNIEIDAKNNSDTASVQDDVIKPQNDVIKPETDASDPLSGTDTDVAAMFDEISVSDDNNTEDISDLLSDWSDDDWKNIAKDMFSDESEEDADAEVEHENTQTDSAENSKVSDDNAEPNHDLRSGMIDDEAVSADERHDDIVEVKNVVLNAKVKADDASLAGNDGCDVELHDIKIDELIRNIETRYAQDYIYVMEDSEIDLGLTVSIERYLDRYLEIIYDFLVWHASKVASSNRSEEMQDDFDINLDKIAREAETPKDVVKEEEKLGFFQRIIRFLKALFGVKDDEPETPQPVEKSDEPEPDAPLPPPLQDYLQDCFLKYGDNDFDKALAVKETIAYLGLLGYDANRLEKARMKAEETRQKKEEEAELIGEKNREVKGNQE